MSVPKGSRYTKGFGKMFKSTGRFGAVAGRTLPRAQRGSTYIQNPSTGKYAADLSAEPVEAWATTHGAEHAEKVATLSEALREVTQTYAIDLTGSSALNAIPFALEKAAELLEE